MAATSTTPLMNLVLPTVGPTGQIGPTWATNLNDALTAVDSHDHTSGKGPKVPTAGLSINADLSIGGFNLTSVNTTKYNSLLSALASSFTNSVYVVGGELYFNDGSGTDVQITSGGAINVASLGTITGDYSTSSADLNYSNTTKTFTFKQSATATAFISSGAISIFENVNGAKFTKLQTTTGQASDQTVTLWASFPASTLPVSLSNSGVLSSGQIITAQIADSNVTTAKIADSNVTTIKIADSNVTTAKIADQNVTRVKVATRVASSTNAPLGGVLITGTSSGFNTTSTSYVAVSSLNGNITTGGGPVVIKCISDGTSSSFEALGTTAAEMYVAIMRDATMIGEYKLNSLVVGGNTSNLLNVPASIVSQMENPAAGIYTYSIRIKAGVANTASALQMRLVVYEV